ncbi:hypothetical protein VKT23_012621 [Stygiomarasmius scandens]|uniref:Uncharacterized protein n=1 Tax=Marasmiellus scandens TaxID=2682957 RepID=A0ABR1JB35_9AGAR
MARRSERLANTSLPEKRLKLRRSPSPQSEYEQDSDSDYFPSAERRKRRSPPDHHGDPDRGTIGSRILTFRHYMDFVIRLDLYLTL